MAPKRQAQDAFGHVSAFAAARQSKQPQPVSASVSEPEPGAEPFVTKIAAEPYYMADEEVDQAIPVSVKPSVRLSNLSPSAVVQKGDDLEISLELDHSVTLVGEYDLVVLKGLVTIYGSILHPRSGIQRVYALSTSALPSVVAKKDGSVIQARTIRMEASRISRLEQCSPLFRNIGSAESDCKRSFSLLVSSTDDVLQRTLLPLEIDEDTMKVFSRINARLDTVKNFRIMAVGAKSTGKSTFNRLLCNVFTSRSAHPSCLYLDLDPGQPEFGPPGQLSLVEVMSPLLGPSFTHLATVDSRQFRLIRSHSLAATSYKDNPELYVRCAADLFAHANRQLPLVVNACGWVTGLGAATTMKLVDALDLIDVVILQNVDRVLEEELILVPNTYRIRRKQSRIPQRTPAELRAMLTMAYFHHHYRSSDVGMSWNDQSISRMRPWTVSYAGEKPGVVAITSYGSISDSSFLSEVLDGMIVVIVGVEGDSLDLEVMQRTEKEGLPFIEPRTLDSPAFLDPKSSHCIGLALVRGIDVGKQRLELVAPLNKSQIAEVTKLQVILLIGSLDSPDWAYLEDLYAKDSETTDFDERPWVTRNELVGIEGSVWRLRHPPTASDIRNAY